MFGIEKMPNLLAAKNKFILNIYDTYAPKVFERLPRKHSWWSHFDIKLLV